MKSPPSSSTEEDSPSSTIATPVSPSRRASNASMILSFGTAHFPPPMPEPLEAPTNPAFVPAITAYSVPRWKRLAQVGATVVYCFFAAGVVFGFAALKPVLKEENAYRDVCVASLRGGLAPMSGLEEPDEEDVETCMDLKLNMIFTLAAVGTNVAALPVGTFLDVFGPRNCALMGSCFLFLGSLLLAHASTLAPHFDAYLTGYLFLALGGPSVFISSFHLSNAFPGREGTILALLTGAFDASSAIFLGYRILYEDSGGAVGPRKFFTVYLIVPVAIAVIQLTLMEGGIYQTVVPGAGDGERTPVNKAGPNETTSLLRGETLVDDMGTLVQKWKGAKQDPKLQPSQRGIAGVLHGLSARQQMKTWWFVLITLFTIIQMLRLNFFISTVRSQYTFLLSSDDDAERLNHIFDTLLPVGGLISIPFIGSAIDALSTLSVLSLMTVLTTLIGILNLIPGSFTAGVLNIVLFVVYRPFYYTVVSDYSSKVFGFETFGTVYGTVISVAGMGNFIQRPLDVMFQKNCDGDPTAVNLGLVVVGAVAGTALVGFVWWAVGRREAAARAEEV